MTTWVSGDLLDYYAVKVDPNKERMACSILGDRNIMARLPEVTTETVERVNRRTPPKVVTRTTLLLRGLVFVAFPKGHDVPWFALKQRIHIIRGVIGMNHVPSRLDPAGLLNLFNNIVFTSIEVQKFRRTYCAGDRVKFVGGALAGFSADVVEASADELRLLCSVFGRRTPVTLRTDQQGLIEPDVAAAASRAA